MATPAALDYTLQSFPTPYGPPHNPRRDAIPLDVCPRGGCLLHLTMLIKGSMLGTVVIAMDDSLLGSLPFTRRSLAPLSRFLGVIPTVPVGPPGI